MMTLAALVAANQPDPSIVDLVQWLSSIGGTAVLAFAVIAFLKRWIVTIGELRDEQAASAAKDLLLAAKDKQLADAMNTIVNDTVPALVKATVVMEHQGAELRKRGGET
jgi:ATP-dependent protease ClpP protease subunit